MPLLKPLQKPGPRSETAFLSFLKGTSVGEWLRRSLQEPGRWLFGFPEGTKRVAGWWLFGFLKGTKRVAGRWRSRATPGRSKKKRCTPACQGVGIQTVRPAATPRLCHPAGVRALFGPVSGGGATHRLGSLREPEGCTNASGISRRFPEGTPSRAVVRTLRLHKRRENHPPWNSPDNPRWAASDTDRIPSSVRIR
jgi:hypothetical protein